MIKAERQKKILSIINIEQKVIASDLAILFQVSEDTIRRDLNDLDNQKLLKRVHSGALKIGPPVTDFSFRTSIDHELKSQLGTVALQFLKQDSVIIIDGGTTNLSLAQQIPLDFKATIITNSPPISIALAKHKNLEIINLGGYFYQQSMINIGEDIFNSLQHIHADLYIMGIHNVDYINGTSVPTLPEANIKRKMTEVSVETLGIATFDKFGFTSNYIVSPISALTYLISKSVPEYVKNQYTSTDLIIV